MTPDGIIGDKNRLPWTLSSDIRRFRRVTMGHPLIMGWKTFIGIVESLGGPLDGRPSIVLTGGHTRDVENQNGIAVPSPEAAFATAKRFDKEPFVVGGAKVYGRMLPLCQVLHITTVYPPEGRRIEGDTRLDLPNLERWQLLDWQSRKRWLPDDLYETSYAVYHR